MTDIEKPSEEDPGNVAPATDVVPTNPMVHADLTLGPPAGTDSTIDDSTTRHVPRRVLNMLDRHSLTISVFSLFLSSGATFGSIYTSNKRARVYEHEIAVLVAEAKHEKAVAEGWIESAIKSRCALCAGQTWRNADRVYSLSDSESKNSFLCQEIKNINEEIAHTVGTCKELEHVKPEEITDPKIRQSVANGQTCLGNQVDVNKKLADKLNERKIELTCPP